MTPPGALLHVLPGGRDDALAFLTGIEQRGGVPPVDETEHDRLRSDPPPPGWEPRLAVLGGTPVGYAGVRREGGSSTGSGATVVAELAVVPGADGREALGGLLDGIGVAGRARAWLRGADGALLDVAARSGWVPDEQLEVLGLAVDLAASGATTPPVVPDGLHLRTFADADADAVERLLAAAHPDSSDGWGAGGFARRRAAGWFRADDLLLLEEGGTLLGVHWMKRRGPGLGEVHNLAVHPDAQGRGLGALLLDAGLAHLAAAGCTEVLLWVAASNAPARRLYASRGFAHRWDDVALVPAQPSAMPSSPPR